MLVAIFRANAKQACVIWGWTLEVEGLLHGGSWQGLVQGALRALRAGRHMAMGVPRRNMLEDMCHGFVGGTGFASDISAGLEVQFLCKLLCPALPCSALPCPAPHCTALPCPALPCPHTDWLESSSEYFTMSNSRHSLHM